MTMEVTSHSNSNTLGLKFDKASISDDMTLKTTNEDSAADDDDDRHHPDTVILGDTPAEAPLDLEVTEKKRENQKDIRKIPYYNPDRFRTGGSQRVRIHNPSL